MGRKREQESCRATVEHVGGIAAQIKEAHSGYGVVEAAACIPQPPGGDWLKPLLGVNNWPTAPIRPLSSDDQIRWSTPRGGGRRGLRLRAASSYVGSSVGGRWLLDVYEEPDELLDDRSVLDQHSKRLRDRSEPENRDRRSTSPSAAATACRDANNPPQRGRPETYSDAPKLIRIVGVVSECGRRAVNPIVYRALKCTPTALECPLTRAGATGLEPATSGVTGRRSNQLSYAPERTRWADWERPGRRI